MASTETEQLVVQLEAKIDAFEKNFAKASQTANSNWSAIEARGKRAADKMQSDIQTATAGIASGFKALSSTITSSFGVTGILSATGFLAAAIKINSELAKMAGLAKTAGISTDRLQEVKYAANLGGVSDDDFKASLQSSVALLDEAQRQVNDLQRLFNANGKSIRDSNGQLIKFDELLARAAELMQHAPSEQAKVKITEMLGLSRDWIRVLSGGPEAFRRVQDEARQAGVIVDEATIQKAKAFDVAWAKSIVRFKAGFTESLAEISEAFGTFWTELIDDIPGGTFIADKLKAMFGGLDRLTIPELRDALKRSIEQGVDKVEIQRIQEELDQRLGKAPLRITVRPTIENAAGDSNGAPTVIPKDKEKNPFERAMFKANKRIAATDAETKTIGLNSEARERAKLVAELEESAKKANTEAGFQNAIVTDQQREKINKLADAMDAAGKRQREAQEQFKAMNELLQAGGNLAVTWVEKLADGSAKLKDLLADVIKTLEKAGIQAAIVGTGPLAGIFGTASTVAGGTGGIMGALGSLFGGARADGGDVSPDKAFLVGERGPEIMIPKTAGTIIPNHDLGRGGGGSVNNTTMHNNVTVNANGGGGSAAQNQDLAERVGRAVESSARSMIAAEIRMQMRPNGLLRGR